VDDSARPASSRPAALLRAALLPLLAAGIFPATAGAQATTIARADGLGVYELWSATAGSAHLLGSGLSFLPLDVAGRTFRDRLRLDLPSLAGVGSPAPHARLPGGGSVFLLGFGDATVLLHVASDGMPSAAAVTPGALSTLALAADGSRALLATSVAAGGNVLLVDLADSAAFPAVDLTAALPPLDVQPDSLRVSSRRAWFLADGRLWRADLQASGTSALAQPVALTVGTGDTLSPETVLSADGLSLALLSSAPGGLGLLHVVTPAGSAVLLTPDAVAIDAPALLSPLGPLLALSGDGKLAAWRQTVGGSKEIFLQAVPQPGPPPPTPVQLTANTYFTDTLDNAGILGFASQSVLTFVAGEAGGGAVGAADLYTAHLGTLGGGPVLQNATFTSGDTVPPFLVPGELEILSAQLDPLAERMLFVVDPHGADAGLYATAADGTGPGELLLPGFKTQPVLLRAGASIFLQSVPDAAPKDGTELHLLAPASAGGAVLPLGKLPPGLSLDRFVDSGDELRAAFVVSAGPALQLPLRLSLPAGALLPAWGQLFQVAPLLALPPSGALVTGVGLPGGPYLDIAFAGFAQGAVLPVPAGFSFPLPY